MLYLKLFGRKSSSVFPWTVQSIRRIVHVVTAKLYVDRKSFRKDILKKFEQCNRCIYLLLLNRMGVQS